MNTIGVVVLTLLAVQCCEPKSLRGLGQVDRNTYDVCPYQRPNTYCTQGLFFPSIDESDCYDDTECSSPMKCCMQGCSKKCVEPVDNSTWTDAPVDLGIVFEANGTTWEKVKNMIKKVVNAATVSKDVTHIAMVTTAQTSQTLWSFNQLSDSEISRGKVLSIIDGFQPEVRPGNLSKALKKAKKMFKKSNGARKDAIKVLLVISDANLGPDAESALAASKSLRKSGVLVNTIGVTMEMSLMYLVEIATSDYYVWADVDDELLSMLEELEKQPGGINHSSQTVGLSKL